MLFPDPAAAQTLKEVGGMPSVESSAKSSSVRTIPVSPWLPARPVETPCRSVSMSKYVEERNALYHFTQPATFPLPNPKKRTNVRSVKAGDEEDAAEGRRGRARRTVVVPQELRDAPQVATPKDTPSKTPSKNKMNSCGSITPISPTSKTTQCFRGGELATGRAGRHSKSPP